MENAIYRASYSDGGSGGDANFIQLSQSFVIPSQVLSLAPQRYEHDTLGVFKKKKKFSQKLCNVNERV